MPRPISMTIHRAALATNLAIARRLASADGFALLDLHEAAQLRDLGWTGPILLLEGFFDESDIALLASLRLTTAVHGEEQLRMLEVASHGGRLPPQSLDVCLKLNSGMNRLGFSLDEYGAAWRRLSDIAAVRSVTHMSHFSDADTQKGVAEQAATS